MPQQSTDRVSETFETDTILCAEMFSISIHEVLRLLTRTCHSPAQLKTRMNRGPRKLKRLAADETEDCQRSVRVKCKESPHPTRPVLAVKVLSPDSVGRKTDVLFPARRPCSGRGEIQR